LIKVLLIAGLAFEAEVARLGAPQPEKRRQARAALVVAGDKAVPALRAGLKATDPEVRRESAGMLDRLLEKTVKAQRKNYSVYTIPKNRMTQRVKNWQRRVQIQLIAHGGWIESFESNYTGDLGKWRSPTAGDYTRLLRTLTHHIKSTHAGPTSLESLLACRAIVRKLDQLEPGLGKPHWTMRWTVRRELLPAVRAVVRGRGPALSRVEADMFVRLCKHIEPLCDEPTAKVRKLIVVRLSRKG